MDYKPEVQYITFQSWINQARIYSCDNGFNQLIKNTAHISLVNVLYIATNDKCNHFKEGTCVVVWEKPLDMAEFWKSQNKTKQNQKQQKWDHVYGVITPFPV